MNTQRPYDATYEHLFGTPPPQSVTWGESSADIISPGRGFMAAFDWTMQIQVGCPGGCLFCYVKAGGLTTPLEIKGNQGEQWGFVVKNKLNVEKKLKKHLEKHDLAGTTIYWSGVTDPYVASPLVTKMVWQTLCEIPAQLRPRRIAVQTRFHPERDVNLIAQYCSSPSTSDQGPPVVVSYSIGMDRNDLIRAWERATPPFEQRLKTIRVLRDAGIWVVPTLSPFGLWNDLPGTLKQFKAWDIPYITCLFFKEDTRSANTPPLFLEYLRKEYPFLVDPAWQAERVHEMKDIYGKDRVLIGQEGFASLTRPHTVPETGSEFVTSTNMA